MGYTAHQDLGTGLLKDLGISRELDKGYTVHQVWNPYYSMVINK